MFVPFTRTLRARAVDSVPRPTLYAVVATLLVGGWCVWLTNARVSLYESSDRARIEVTEIGNGIEAPISGRIATTAGALGQSVEKGTVIATLDAAVVEQRLAEARAKHAALVPQMESRRKQIDALADLQAKRAEHAQKAGEAARAKREEADVQARLAADEARRTAQLFQSKSVSEAENARARADAEQKKATLEAAGLEIARLDRQLASEESELTVRIAALRSEVADLASQEESTAAAVAALSRELDAYTIRAPVSGKLAEISSKRPGAFVQAGERLATIVPEGDLRAVGEFDPASAVGRGRVGQPALVRLDGFPFLQYGSVPATVARVGTEVRDGKVRVELTLHPDPQSAIPLQHGLPGRVEVEVDRLTPWALVLRTAGRALVARESSGR